MEYGTNSATDNRGIFKHGFGRAFVFCVIYQKDLSLFIREIRGLNFLRVFLPFPQASPILHSFCTTQHQFSVAIDSAFAQSAHSASVRCIQPAGDCGRAGGDRRFSRVNRREGFQKVRFGASQKTRALRPPQTVLPKKQDLSRPLPQSLRVKNPRIRVFG